jgi:hypothetical protein
MTSWGLKQKHVVIPCALRREVPLRRHGTHAGFGWCLGWQHVWVPEQRSSTACCTASGMTSWGVKAKTRCHPVRAAARSAAAQTRDPCGVRLVFGVAARLGPGTAGQHFVLHRIRDDILGVKAKARCHPVRAAARSAAAQTRDPCGVRLVFRVVARVGPGTAEQHCVLRRIRDDAVRVNPRGGRLRGGRRGRARRGFSSEWP